MSVKCCLLIINYTKKQRTVLGVWPDQSVSDAGDFSTFSRCRCVSTNCLHGRFLARSPTSLSLVLTQHVTKRVKAKKNKRIKQQCAQIKTTRAKCQTEFTFFSTVHLSALQSWFALHRVNRDASLVLWQTGGLRRNTNTQTHKHAEIIDSLSDFIS